VDSWLVMSLVLYSFAAQLNIMPGPSFVVLSLVLLGWGPSILTVNNGVLLNELEI